MEKNALFILSIGLLLIVLSGLQFDRYPVESWLGILCLGTGGFLFYPHLKKTNSKAKEEKK